MVYGYVMHYTVGQSACQVLGITLRQITKKIELRKIEKQPKKSCKNSKILIHFYQESERIPVRLEVEEWLPHSKMESTGGEKLSSLKKSVSIV